MKALRFLIFLAAVSTASAQFIRVNTNQALQGSFTNFFHTNKALLPGLLPQLADGNGNGASMTNLGGVTTTNLDAGGGVLTANETGVYVGGAGVQIDSQASFTAGDTTSFQWDVNVADGTNEPSIRLGRDGTVSASSLAANTITATGTVTSTLFSGSGAGLTGIPATAEAISIPTANALHGLSRTLNADVFARRLYANMVPSAAYPTTNLNMVVMGDSVAEAFSRHLGNYLASGLGHNGSLNIGQTNGTAYFDGQGSLAYALNGGSGTITLVTNYDAWPIPYYRYDAGAYRQIGSSNYNVSPTATNGLRVTRISATWITHPGDGTLTVSASTNGGTFGTVASWSLDGTDGAMFHTNFAVSLGSQPVRIQFGVVGGAGGDLVTLGAYGHNYAGLNYSTFAKSGISISNLFRLTSATNFVSWLKTNEVQLLTWHGKEDQADLTNAKPAMDFIVTNATNVAFCWQGTPPDQYADQPVQNDWIRDWCKLRRQFYFDGNTMFGGTNQMIELGWLGYNYGAGPDYIHTRTTTGAGALWLANFLQAVPLDALCVPVFSRITHNSRYGIANPQTAEIPLSSQFADPGAERYHWTLLSLMRGVKIGSNFDTNGNDGAIYMMATNSSPLYYTKWQMWGDSNIWQNAWGDKLVHDMSRTNFAIYSTNKLTIGTPVNPVTTVYSGLTVSTLTNNTYTAALGDQWLRMTNATAITVTIPASTFPIGYQITLSQAGAGQVTLTNAVGVTLMSAETTKTRTTNSVMTATQVLTNMWNICGDVEVLP